MRQINRILYLSLIVLGSLLCASAEVTHEEIRGTLQSLIYSYNQLDNKLERHEHRERALGELMKKAMQTLQKGQKNLEPINGILNRLDERVSQIETMLMNQEEKYNLQTDKLGEALEHIFKWMHENNECMKRPPIGGGPSLPAAVPAAIPPEFVKKQDQINNMVLQQLEKLTDNVDKLLVSSKDIIEQTEVAFKNAPNTTEMLNKIEDKLVSYSVVTPPSEPVYNKEFEQKMLENLEKINTGLAALQTVSEPTEVLTVLDKKFMESLNNETLNALETVKEATINAADKACSQTEVAIKVNAELMDKRLSSLIEDTSTSKELLQKFYDEMNATYTKLDNALQVFDKFNNVLMTNSEAVIDTQRKVDFGTISTVQKIGSQLEKQREEILNVVNERFGNVNETIVSTQMEALQNLTSLFESEISSVWQQISIMHGEITSSKDLLGVMSERNDGYVNNTHAFMEVMGGKVEVIKSNMMDMDSNLNFLLGKLSIMSQEFSNIKLGLAESLDELRKTFHDMQEQMPGDHKSPGPHQIAKNEYETELNLLKKRQTV